MDLTWMKVPMTMIPSKFTHIKRNNHPKKKRKKKKEKPMVTMIPSKNSNGHDDPIKTHT
jgi:hypothetical protein